jgi:transcriptional regulator with XRE-family HTH domain
LKGHGSLERVLSPQSAGKSLKGTELGRRLQKVRSELGLKQIEFANLLGVSSGTMSQWESGAFVPRKSLLERIAEVVPEHHKSYFLGLERPARQKLAQRTYPQLNDAEQDLLERQKAEFVRKLKNHVGPLLKTWNSVHIQVTNISEQRVVSFSVNHPFNKGVIVYLDRDLRAHRTDIHASQFRNLGVDWATLLLPFGRRWTKLTLIFGQSDRLSTQ